MADCPVCQGRGVMPGAFYGMAQEVVTCRSCGGTTVVEPTELTAAQRPAGYDDHDLTGS